MESRPTNASTVPAGSPVWRNIRGMEYERSHDVDAAMELYEANVAEGWVGQYPYERLRILYTRRADYANAIRVCELATEVLHASPTKVHKFIEAMGKLMLKQARAARSLERPRP